MKNLPLPSRDAAKTDLETVLQTYQYKGEIKGYDANAAEIEAVLALYDTYDLAFGMPSEPLKGPGMDAKMLKALKSAYGQTYEGRKISHVREAAFKGVDLCPICGIDEPDQLDHHLPQSSYNPLSIYPRNLVPLCHDCNFIKRAHDDGNFVHAYFDQVPTTQFVQVDVSIVDSGLLTVFSIAQVEGMSEALKDRLRFQLDTLDLNGRFQKEVNTYLSGQTTGLHSAYDLAAAAGVKAHLNRQARVELVGTHRNHWKPVLFGALADHVPFCEEGFKIVLPEPSDEELAAV